jgi:hypothetical protein
MTTLIERWLELIEKDERSSSFQYESMAVQMLEGALEQYNDPNYKWKAMSILMGAFMHPNEYIPVQILYSAIKENPINAIDSIYNHSTDVHIYLSSRFCVNNKSLLQG